MNAESLQFPARPTLIAAAIFSGNQFKVNADSFFNGSAIRTDSLRVVDQGKFQSNHFQNYQLNKYPAVDLISIQKNLFGHRV